MVASSPMLSGKRPANLGVKDGRLAPPKRTPNCVSSQAERSDVEHYVEPIAFKGSISEAMLAARRAIESTERSCIVVQERGYLYAEFRSKLLGYVDDLELFYDAKGGVFHVRSASRLGRRDYGVNRKRVESLRRLLQFP